MLLAYPARCGALAACLPLLSSSSTQVRQCARDRPRAPPQAVPANQPPAACRRISSARPRLPFQTPARPSSPSSQAPSANASPESPLPDARIRRGLAAARRQFESANPRSLSARTGLLSGVRLAPPSHSHGSFVPFGLLRIPSGRPGSFLLEYEQSEKETCVVAKSFIFH